MTLPENFPDYLIEKIQELAFTKVGHHDPLLSSGVLDSVNVVELSVEIERHLGIQIPFEAINAEHFHSVQSICDYLGTIH